MKAGTTTKTIATASIATLLAVVAVAGITSADENSTRHDELIDKISTSHNIDKSELEATFDEFKQEREAEREAEHQERLQSLVDSGTITAEQKDALIAKHKEMKEAIDTLIDSEASREEIHEKRKELRQELQAWAESQGIDLKAIRPEGRGGHHGKGNQHRFGHDESEDS